jgi:hypothetical protein
MFFLPSQFYDKSIIAALGGAGENYTMGKIKSIEI